MNLKQKGNAALIAVIVILVLLIIGAGIYYFVKKSQKSEVSTTPASSPTVTATTKTTLVEYQIKDVPYYAEAGFCYGASTMMVLEYKGLTKDQVEEYKSAVKKGKGGPPDMFIGLENLGLKKYVYMAYSKDYNQEFAKSYNSFVNDATKQVKTFASQDEALKKLKELISQDNPAIVIIDDGNHYVVAIGYDKDYIYVNDPDPDKGGKDKKIQINNFLEQWNIKSQSETTGDKMGYPGNYGTIWFEGKLEVSKNGDNDDEDIDDENGDDDLEEDGMED